MDCMTVMLCMHCFIIIIIFQAASESFKRSSTQVIHALSFECIGYCGWLAVVRCVGFLAWAFAKHSAPRVVADVINFGGLKVLATRFCIYSKSFKRVHHCICIFNMERFRFISDLCERFLQVAVIMPAMLRCLYSC